MLFFDLVSPPAISGVVVASHLLARHEKRRAQGGWTYLCHGSRPGFHDGRGYQCFSPFIGESLAMHRMELSTNPQLWHMGITIFMDANSPSAKYHRVPSSAFSHRDMHRYLAAARQSPGSARVRGNSIPRS